jgi:penicillin-binding protein 2
VIRDRNGIVLAQSYSAYTLEIQPARVKDLDQTIDALSEVIEIQPRDRKRFKKLMDESKSFESLPIRTRLTDNEVARFAVNRYRFPGVEIKARLFRQYPYAELASHVVGYIGRINDRDLTRIDEWGDAANYKGSDYIGKVGIELSYERELHGTTGVEEVEVDAGGRAVRTLSRVAPTSGNDLFLTLDIKLQEIAEAAFGTRRGALVALDPSTGEVLAMVSKPGFDPNLFVDGIDSANWEMLNESPDKPLLNRPLRGAYPPARRSSRSCARRSHFGKEDAGADDLRSGFFPDRGPGAPLSRRQAGWARHRRHVQVDRRFLRHVLLHAGERDRHRRHRALHVATGLRQEDGHRCRGRARRRAAVARVEAAALFRQGISRGAPQVVPGRQHLGRHRPGIQRVHADSARACHRHDRQRRRLACAASRARHPAHGHGRAAPRAGAPPQALGVKPEHLAFIKNALVGVQKEGTSAAAFLKTPYVSAGKTGTAQLYSLKGDKVRRGQVDERLRDHAWYIAYAPADHPKIALAVLVENGGFGAQAAAPIARQVFDYVLAGEKKGRAGAGVLRARVRRPERLGIDRRWANSSLASGTSCRGASTASCSASR